jgi:hypothetical protein
MSASLTFDGRLFARFMRARGTASPIEAALTALRGANEAVGFDGRHGAAGNALFAIGWAVETGRAPTAFTFYLAAINARQMRRLLEHTLASSDRSVAGYWAAARAAAGC